MGGNTDLELQVTMRLMLGENRLRMPPVQQYGGHPVLKRTFVDFTVI
jgi:hypothetical protein